MQLTIRVAKTCMALSRIAPKQQYFKSLEKNVMPITRNGLLNAISPFPPLLNIPGLLDAVGRLDLRAKVTDRYILSNPQWERNMSNCPHCNRETFEIEEVEVSGVKLKLVQCAGCKAPVGIIEHNDVGKVIHDLEQRVTEVLRVLASSLQKMNSRLTQIERAKE